ncbi:MAG TPA: universal stress protein [Actinomycetota bacterium]|nr:universal stress protein [Actinomycetota bacterium]
MAYKRILVGTDGSPPSLKSVREAARLAKSFAAELLVVCAYGALDQGTVDRWREEAPEEISWRFTPSTIADEAIVKGESTAAAEGVTPRMLTERGEAADVLIRVAEHENADLIVVGNRGMTGTTRFLLGSVPNKVSHNAPCDVMIIKTIP